MNSEVVWKPIPGYEQLYEISNTGFVRNVHTGLIKSNGIEWNRHQWVCSYSTMQTQSPTKILHSPIGSDLLDWNPQNKPQVNHKDMNRSNNCIDNLEWVTNSENQLHAIACRGTLPNQFQNVSYQLTKADGTTIVFKSMNELTKSIDRSFETMGL